MAVTLSYTYKSVPSSLPPSTTGEEAEGAKPKYVVSQSGHAAHPDEIIASCQALQAHIQQLQDSAAATLGKWQEDIQQRELAEKRRVAPGWLDREEKILEPQRTHSAMASQGSASAPSQPSMKPRTAVPDSVDQDEGRAMDRAFGGMNIK